MERAISEMEKIRKAEEIYSRRKNGTVLSSNKEEKIKNKSLYRILFQFLLLFNIAVVIVAVQNKNYIFTEEFLKQANKYNIDIKSKVNEFVTYLNGNELLTNSTNEVNSEKENNSDNNQVESEENSSEQIINQEEIKAENNNIGMIDNIQENINQNNNVREQKNDIVSSLSQMDIDINEIKSKYSLIKPVSGTKTSGFGTRESSEIVTSYHTGVDIANVKGTIIKSAIDGKVTQVSEEGDYGKHLRISVDNLVTLYAHCDKIYVKEGDEIRQGQDIAEVGSTGNSTGNHLHFEIRYENRYIDPEKLIEI